MATLDLNKLTNDILNANNSAFMYSEVEDGGSCNFDTPILKINLSRKEKELMKNLLIPVDDRGYKGWYFVEVALMGQGSRRTAMAEAAASHLKAEGYEVSVYYQLD